jgi:hypothetical protein
MAGGFRTGATGASPVGPGQPVQSFLERTGRGAIQRRCCARRPLAGARAADFRGGLRAHADRPRRSRSSHLRVHDEVIRAFPMDRAPQLYAPREASPAHRRCATRESLRPRLATNLRRAADASNPGGTRSKRRTGHGDRWSGGMSLSTFTDGLGGAIFAGPESADLASEPLSEDGRRALARNAKPERLTTVPRSRGVRDDATGRRGAPGKQERGHPLRSRLVLLLTICDGKAAPSLTSRDQNRQESQQFPCAC